MIPFCLSVLLISFGMIVSSSIHDVANGNISFFFGSRVFSHPANLCLLNEEFNPFIFEVIPEKEELTSVYVSSTCLIVFFAPHFLHYCLLLSIFCSEKSKFLSHFLLCIFYNYFLCGYHGDYIQHVEVLILKSEFIPA